MTYQKYTTGVRGMTATVFEDEETHNKNIALQFSLKEDKIPELNNGYLNIKFYPDQIMKIYDAIQQIAKENGIELKNNPVRKID